MSFLFSDGSPHHTTAQFYFYSVRSATQREAQDDGMHRWIGLTDRSALAAGYIALSGEFWWLEDRGVSRARLVQYTLDIRILS